MFLGKRSGTPHKLSEIAASKIRDMIIGGELCPGEPLAELKLAEQLSMSRTPIREAISQLEFEGTLLSIPGRGAIVTAIAKEDFLEINALRIALEPLAATAALNVIPRPVIMQIKERWAKFMSDFNSELEISSADLTNEDAHLHSLFIENCGNKRLTNILRVLQFQAKRYIFAHWDTKAYVGESIAQHLDIVVGFEKFDKELIKSSLEKHLEYNNMFIDIYNNDYLP